MALLGIIGGIERVNTSMFIEGNLGALQVHRSGYVAALTSNPLRLAMEDSPSFRERLLTVPGVKAVSPRIAFSALLSTSLAGGEEGEAAPLVLTGVEVGLEKAVFPRRDSWVSAWPKPGEDPMGVTLAFDFAQALKAVETHEEGVLKLAVLASDQDDLLNGVNAALVGTVKSGMAGDRRYGFVDLRAAQVLLRMEGKVTEYAVAVHDWNALADVKAQLVSALGPGFEVHRWDELMPLLKNITRAQRGFAGALAAIVLGVVLLGFANTMLLSVNDRVREIGVMLSLGLTRAQVRSLFLWEGAALSILAALAGCATGLAALRAIEASGLELASPGGNVKLLIVPVVPLFVVGALGVITAVGGMAAAFWAAGRAATLSPVEALRE